MYPESEVYLVRWPVAKEAPFNFDSEGIEIYNRSDYDDAELMQLALRINPDVILCSGWMDKGYVAVCKNFKGQIPTVLTLDNHWTGSVKQMVASVLSRFVILNKFSHAWVPGQPQKEYALKLGFKSTNIFERFYCADTRLFRSYFEQTKLQKENAIPKAFLYVGRYVEHKGIFEMWEAFIDFQKDNKDWELWCIGTGDQFDNKVEHNSIKHFGFVQPSDFLEYIQKTGVYILPSKFEPWGVSLHEFAAAGMPILTSKEVGAAEAFLESGKNGFIFNSGSKSEIKQAFEKMAALSQDDLIKMKQHSLKLADKVTPNQWAVTLMEIIKRKDKS
jgi:glycosyltransferase involved in cell wall biosynthesis